MLLYVWNELYGRSRDDYYVSINIPHRIYSIDQRHDDSSDEEDDDDSSSHVRTTKRMIPMDPDESKDEMYLYLSSWWVW